MANAAPPLNGHSNPLLDLQLSMLLMRGELDPNLGTLVWTGPARGSALLYFALGARGCWLWRRLQQGTSIAENTNSTEVV